MIRSPTVGAIVIDARNKTRALILAVTDSDVTLVCLTKKGRERGLPWLLPLRFTQHRSCGWTRGNG